MSSNLGPNEVELLRAIDSIADRFEAEWISDREPKIEDYLEEFPAAERTRLISELVTIELEWRAKRGLPIDPTEYEKRFPESSEVISAIVKSWHQQSSANPNSSKQADEEAERNRTTVISSHAGRSSLPVGKRSKRTAESAELPKKIDRYRIKKRLGSGAMGDVYLAHDEKLQRLVALKVPKLKIGEEGEAEERFQREAQAAATLNHPNICPVHDIGEADGHRFITMAYIEGHSLQEITKKGVPQPVRQAALLIRRLAAALQVAHDVGVVHRDLKPANIMIDKKKQPIIMDFGLALLVNREEEARLTHDGAIIGSPAYMSPEQVSRDPNAVGPASDIYTLGVIFYELLAGRLPYQGNVLAVLSQIQTTDPPPIETLRSDLDPGLARIVTRMMARLPEERYATMSDLANDLTRWLKGEASSETDSPEQTFAKIAQLDATRVKTKTAPQKSRFLTKKSMVALASGAFALLLGVILVLKFSSGTVQIEISDDRIGVELEGETIRFTDLAWNEERLAGNYTLGVVVNGTRVPIGESLTVVIDGQQHELVAMLNSARLSSNEFQLDRGETAAITMKLVPISEPPPTEKSVAEKPDVPKPPPPAIYLHHLWSSYLKDEKEGSTVKHYLDFVGDGTSFIAGQGGTWSRVVRHQSHDASEISKLPYPFTTWYLATSPDSERLAAIVTDSGGGWHTEIKDLKRGTTITLPKSDLESNPDFDNKKLALSADGTRCVLAVSRFDKEKMVVGQPTLGLRHFDLIAWDVPSKKILWERSMPKGSNLDYIRLSHDGHYLLTGNVRTKSNQGYGPELLDGETGATLRELFDITRGSSADAEFLPQTSAALIVDFKGGFVRIDLSSPDEHRDYSWLRPEDGDFNNTETAPNGVPWFMPKEGLTVKEIEVTADGRYAWTARGDGRVAIWDLEQGQRLKEYEEMYRERNFLAHHGGMELSHNGEYLMFSDNKGEVRMFNVSADAEQPSEKSLEPPVALRAW